MPEQRPVRASAAGSTRADRPNSIPVDQRQGKDDITSGNHLEAVGEAVGEEQAEIQLDLVACRTMIRLADSGGAGGYA